MTTLYERIGGETAIMAAVDRFYEKVLADPDLRRFFEGLDLPAQTRKQVSFMAHAFAGPRELKGVRDLGAAHARLVHELGLDSTHFDAVVGHLRSTLQEMGVAEDLVSEAMAVVGSTRAQVLSGHG